MCGDSYGLNQLVKYDDPGALLVSFFQGPGIDDPISMTTNGQTYYYHTDALGSVTELTDASGNVAQSYRYDVFGSIVQQSGSVQNPFTYTGREFDSETGLYYYRARYYDANMGRFLSRDPVARDGTVNLYVHVINNPVMFTDPTGLQHGEPSWQQWNNCRLFMENRTNDELKCQDCEYCCIISTEHWNLACLCLTQDGRDNARHFCSPECPGEEPERPRI